MKGKDGEWIGFCVNIWEAVAKGLKVTYEFKEMQFSELLDSLKKTRLMLRLMVSFCWRSVENTWTSQSLSAAPALPWRPYPTNWIIPG